LADNNSDYYVIWNEVSDNSTRFTDSYSLSTIYNLNSSGQAVQLSNGADRNSMYASVFTNSSEPYHFNTSASIGSIDMHKISVASNDNNIGRGGVVIEDSVGIYFSIQKIQLDNQVIDFEAASDTLTINNINQLNKYLISKPFTLTDTSSLFCSVQYGVTDTIKAKNIFGTNGSVSYALTLVDANTGQTIGNINGVTFDNNNVPYYRTRSYQVSTNGIGGRQARLRLTANLTNGAVNNTSTGFALTLSYSILGDAILKSRMQQVSYEGGEVIKTYSLDQNYPNPFNPSTIINYQILKGGYVTLKVYDILGREVKTLVDGYKAQGSYDVSFDASNLASGVYFYQLKAGEFYSVKKMLLVK